jgi:DNA processing protein
VLNFADQTPPGNRLLIDAGAQPISSRHELGQVLDALGDEPQQCLLV